MRQEAVPGFIGLPEPWSSVVIAALAIVVVAWIAVLVSTVKGVLRAPLDKGMKVVWIALIMSSQPLGVLLWHTVGRRQSGPLPN